MTNRHWILAAILALGACTDIPRDPERTESLVRETGTIRLGVTNGGKQSEDAKRALERVAAITNARIERRMGESEQLLSELRDGRIDLVYGSFADASPWGKEVHFTSAPGWRAKPPPSQAVPRFAIRNGENGWLMLVENAIDP